MKSTSPSCKSVSSAARSPGRESTGPEVMRSPAPISAATMLASEVLPSPGGPAKRGDRRVWWRARAEPSTISRWRTSSRCPTNSAKRTRSQRHFGATLLFVGDRQRPRARSTVRRRSRGGSRAPQELQCLTQAPRIRRPGTSCRSSAWRTSCVLYPRPRSASSMASFCGGRP